MALSRFAATLGDDAQERAILPLSASDPVASS
jgi:hypothetical protein